MYVIFIRSFVFLLLLFNLNQSIANGPEQAFKLLTSSSFDDKSIAIGLLAQTADATSYSLLNAMAQGYLYYVKKNNRFVLAKKQGIKFHMTDALTGEDLGLVSKRKVKKVSVNNKLRGQISTVISNFKLFHADASIRLIAVEKLMANASPKMLAQLQTIRLKESDPDVLDAIDIVTAFSQLESANPKHQLSAIEILDGHLNPSVLIQLKKMSSPGNNASVRLAAKKSVSNIDSKVSIFGHLETLFFGLSLGSILALAAIGLAITFGVMGVINMAHGELIMIGAYTTYVIQLLMPNHIGASLLVAIPAAFLVSALVGIIIERCVIHFLYGRPLETLLATFGISLFLQQAVRSIFSPLNRPVVSPEWMSGSLQINSLLSITYNRLYIFFFCLAIFALLYLIMTKTSLGLHVRAISQNRPMARAMGVRSQWVDVMTFGLGSGIAGVAGVALSQITNVGPNLGQAYIVDSFMVVVFGGVGNLWGTLISGLTLGIVGKFLEPETGAVLAKVLVLLFIILYIQKRPRGMFPQKGRAAE
jgi:urea transport system permease protein